MKYGHFDNEKREYVIDRVDVPTSWTNYLGVEDLCVVVNQTAGGYSFYQSPEYHRITRFRGNSVPMDRPGHYVYLRDDVSKDYWSISWQPVAKPLIHYHCRHGMSYSVYECEYSGIQASQTLVVPRKDQVELWDVKLKNETNETRELSIFSYCEFSYHHIDMDNKNFQMSMYAAGASYENGIIEEDLFYEEEGYQYFTSNFEPDSYDCVRDKFLGLYHTEDNPIALEHGTCSNSSEKGNNHCGSLHKKFVLKPGEEVRYIFMLGEGNRQAGEKIRKKYAKLEQVDQAYEDLHQYWEEKCSQLQIQTPNQGMNTLLNTWTLYQAEINVMFSRFASFIEVGGRTGLGYRDTAQDAMCIPHSNPAKCKQRLIELLRGLVSKGYGLHLFDPEWFAPTKKEQSFRSPTVVPNPNPKDMIHGLEDTCSDDALWLVSAVVQYSKETGDFSFLDEVYTYADGGEGSVYEHLTKILDFSTEQVGKSGICKGLRADWNDCLNLGGGESAMVSFLHYWAMKNFLELAHFKGRQDDVAKYTKVMEKIKEVSEKELWDQEWYIRGVTKNGRKIGTSQDQEGKIHLESNAWAVLSGAVPIEKGKRAMDSIYKKLFTPYGIMLNAPSYTKPDDDIGFVTRVYPGLKENGSIFSHPNPWAWAAECELGRGNRAMEFYEALSPYNQNEAIEMREAEPYSYCQFVVGKDHSAYGRARHPFMTGTGGWAYFSATNYMLGIRPQMDHLEITPCIPKEWKGFCATRKWRGATYEIEVVNPEGVSKGVKAYYMDNKQVAQIPVGEDGSVHRVKVVMGEQAKKKGNGEV